jgi:exoribonuclease-2
MASSTPDLRLIALQAMTVAGLATDFPAQVLHEAQSLIKTGSENTTDDSVRDMREVPWSSIDNNESRDLDQVEYVERLPDGRLRLLIGIADVDMLVPKGSTIDRHAFVNTVSVYTPAIIFPMLPEQLSTDKTSLLEGQDRLAIVIELIITREGVVSSKDTYRARVHNHAKLTYGEVGEWLEGRASAPGRVKDVVGLEAQIRLQMEAAERLQRCAKRMGHSNLRRSKLNLSSPEGEGHRTRYQTSQPGAQYHREFHDCGQHCDGRVPSRERSAVAPESGSYSRTMAPDSKVGCHFRHHSSDSAGFARPIRLLNTTKESNPENYAELSLAILKLLGGGDYKVEAPGVEQEGHFGLAVDDYTHSTAPNRRYPDLITQRCLKAVISGEAPPYTRETLEAIADRCNKMESAARKVERTTENRLWPCS